MIPVKTIRVGPLDYSVKALGTTAAITRFGEHDSNTLEISFCDSFASPAHEAAIAIHELLHAIYSVMGITDKDNEERTVTQLGTGLAMVIHDNPALIKWIVSSLK